MILNLTKEEYFSRNNELSFSSLSNYVKYDNWGTRTTNMISYLYPKKPSNDAITIWTIVDELLTEWETYEEWDETICWYHIVSKKLWKHDKEINTGMLEAVLEHYNQLLIVPELKELFETSEHQTILTWDICGIPCRGKLDLLNKVWDWYTITDLKTSDKTIEYWEKDLLDPRTRTPSKTARVVRQLAFYNMLAEENGIKTKGSFIILSASDGVKFYQIPDTTIALAKAINKQDIEELIKNKKNHTSILTTYNEQTNSNEEITACDY